MPISPSNLLRALRSLVTRDAAAAPGTTFSNTLQPTERTENMTTILYIAASPRGENSQSGKLAEAYLAEQEA